MSVTGRRPVAIALQGVAAVLGLGFSVTGAAAADVTSAPPAGSQHAEVTSAANHAISAPLREMADSETPADAHPAKRHDVHGNSNVQTRDSSGHSSRPRIPSPNTNTNGIGANGSAPPDTSGAAGTTQFVELVNSELAVYSKTGALLYGPVATNTLWSGFGGGCQANNDGDGTVLFDTLAQRWVVQQFSVSTTPYLDCIAVSTSSDATGSYSLYSFQYANFPDYPKTGIWPDAYYASFNLFNAAGTVGLGAELCAFDRAAMVAGRAATQQCFMATSSGENTFLPASLDGSTPPPAGEPEWFVGLSPSSANALGYYRFHVDWTTSANSTLTAGSDLAVAPFTEACSGGTCIPQGGTSNRLDSLGDRLMYRLAYRNFGDHEALVVNHSVAAGSSVGVRWYELRPNGAALSVFQQGTYAPDSNDRWMGSMAMDQSGDMALGFSVSSSSTHPGIRYTGRLAGDAAGSMPQGETTVVTGAGSQTGSLSRWGDYSSMSVDPVDDCTFWYANEYLRSTGSFNWSTQFASFKFSGCGGVQANDFSISASPSTVAVTQGGTGNSTISTAVTSGSAQAISLTASGLPAGASAGFNPSSVTAGSSSILTFTVGSSTSAGTYPVTVTGSAPSGSHTTTVSLVVSAAGGGVGITNGGFETGDFSGWSGGGAATAVLSPGHTGTYAARLGSTSPTNGDSTLQQTFSVPSGGGTLTLWYQPHCPDTLTYDQEQVQIRSTSGSTLATLLNVCSNSGAWTQLRSDLAAFANQTVVLWLNSHDDNYSSDPTYTFFDDVALGASAPPPPTNVVANGGFESGNFSSWSHSGASTGIISGGHSGAYSARLGNTSATKGNSSMQQTITVPAGGGTLTFWYQPHCRDTLAHDQEQMQVRSSSGSTLLSVLNVCSNTGAWTQVTQSLAAYASQTVVLWFNNHDDAHSSDPTYTLFDDVSVG